MGSKEDLFHYRVEGIIVELSNYFEIRYEQLTRIKPSLESMHADLLWQQMEKVRTVMANRKMFGPVRARVGDILPSRDEAKRAAVMGPIDQASILNELVTETEDMGTRRPGMLAIRNMRAFYSEVDRTLGPVIELTDIWLWWDILDAADRFNFKEQKKLIEKRKEEDVTQAMQDFYHEAMARRDEGLLKREEILSYEFAYLEALLKEFTGRRDEEESFMMVLKCDPVGGGDDSVDDLIVAMSRHITACRRLTQEDGLDDRLREYYVKVLKCKAEDVTAERAIAHEELTLGHLRTDLRMGLERGAILGEAYDYKRAQAKEMQRDIEHYRETLPLVESIVAENAPSVAAAPSETPQQAAAAPAQPAAPKPTPQRTQPVEKPLGEQETIADEGPYLL